MGRKKPFIKPNEGVKFYLVNRSQKDPLYLDESLGEHVLVPADPGVRKELIDAVNGLSLNASKKTETEKEALKRKQIEEQNKFGIYMDDGYNYLQHLREVDAHEEEVAEMDQPDLLKIGGVLIKNLDGEDKNPKKLQFPSTVFASQFEEEVGYFNQAAPDHDPKIHWDPEIVKILDEDPDVDFDDDDNFLDDDFFTKANLPEDKKAKGSKNKSLNTDGDEFGSDDQSGSDEDFDSDEAENDWDNFAETQSVKDFETKSRFTEYSMSSSVVHRNDKLRSLDDQFENIFAQYDDEQIGGLEMEEIDGFRTGTDVVLESALQEFDTMMKKVTYETPKKDRPSSKLHAVREEVDEDSEDDSCTDTETDGTECGTDSEGCGDSDEIDNKNAKKNYELVRFKMKKDQDDRLDCESIISTYSTLYNHPATISERRPAIELSKKTGLPLGVLTDKPKTKKQMDIIEHKICRILPEVPVRTRDETKEDRKARKALVKDHRRDRRVEKKINKQMFKHEEKIQICQMANQANQIKLPL